MQRKTAAVIQDGELVHVDVHTLLVFTRQLRPRAQANDRDTHKANDNAPSLRGAPGPPATAQKIYTQVPDTVTREALKRLSDWLDHDQGDGDHR